MKIAGITISGSGFPYMDRGKKPSRGREITKHETVREGKLRLSLDFLFRSVLHTVNGT